MADNDKALAQLTDRHVRETGHKAPNEKCDVCYLLGVMKERKAEQAKIAALQTEIAKLRAEGQSAAKPQTSPQV